MKKHDISDAKFGMSRATFLRLFGGTTLYFIAEQYVYSQNEPALNQELLFLDAPQFTDLGGWDVDQQSLDQMGSAYLLAHGLGIPVKDATTTAKIASPGTYRLWVRTRDWVAPWKAPGAPGRFQVLINDKPQPMIFGTEGADWHWQDGGQVALGSEFKVALHDLTGFEGRCDAILFCKDLNFIPPNELVALTKFRRAAMGLPEVPEEGGDSDLVVVGGGIAGTSAALSAARLGLRVTLIQDRPVLGGNGSSEVRVWPEGHTRQEPYPHIGEIVEELVPPKKPVADSDDHGIAYGDEQRMRVVHAEPRITLRTDERVIAVETQEGKLTAVISQHILSSHRVRIRAKFFADCTGDATVGFLAGADYEISKQNHQGMTNRWSVMDVSNPNEILKCECKDKTALGQMCEMGKIEQPFPRCPWAIDLSTKPFPGQPKDHLGSQHDLDQLGRWFWESGFDKDPIASVEYIRDLNLRAMYGAWDALKNVYKLYPNHRIGWAAFIAGKRESRRLMGDVILDVGDFLSSRSFPDGSFPCSWGIDLHAPEKAYQKGNEGDEFISTFTHGKGYTYKGPYWAPYRCLYSRNIPNLFMAGRNISVTHEGLGPVRVMRTCGMMGEVVGKAASICISENTTPRGVYEKHLDKLKTLMNQPGSTRQV